VGKDEIDALLPLCDYQEYITRCQRVDSFDEVADSVDHVFRNRKTDPEDFFEWRGNIWPENAHLKKIYFFDYFRSRYSLRDLMYMFDPESSWLKCPPSDPVLYDIIVHCPGRKLCRSLDKWIEILRTLHYRGASIAVIAGPNDIDEWPSGEFYTLFVPDDFLKVASLIKDAKLFMGLASCNYVIAEGVDAVRMIDMAPQTQGAEPLNQRGWNITRWDRDRILRSVGKILAGN
jgi:hypothetical protein